jgi:DMSO/TMAO reductase YedYZ molybdopterin-dependent catalytic subunit
MKGAKKNLVVAVLVIVVMAALLAACGSNAPKVDWNIKVSGAVSSPLTVSYADLAKMDQISLKDVLMEKSTGEDTTGNWSGAALQEILTKAGADANFKSITVTAADGYAIEIPKEEMQDGIVALKQDDTWITEADPDHAPLRLVFPHVPANRWVFQVQEIQVNP